MTATTMCIFFLFVLRTCFYWRSYIADTEADWQGLHIDDIVSLSSLVHSLMCVSFVMQFLEIPQVIESAMEAHKADFAAEPSVEDIVNVSSLHIVLRL